MPTDRHTPDPVVAGKPVRAAFDDMAANKRRGDAAPGRRCKIQTAKTPFLPAVDRQFAILDIPVSSRRSLIPQEIEVEPYCSGDCKPRVLLRRREYVIRQGAGDARKLGLLEPYQGDDVS
jgi:hypothetical protein